MGAFSNSKRRRCHRRPETSPGGHPGDPVSQRDGERARDLALDLFADRHDLRDEIDREMRQLYHRRQKRGGHPYVNGDDATLYLDRVRYTGERRIIGTVFGARRGWIYVTSVKSSVKRRHARPIDCWRPR